MSKDKDEIIRMTFSYPQHLKSPIEEAAKLYTGGNKSAFIIKVIEEYLSESSINHIDDKVVVSIKKIRLLLMAQKPDITLINSEVMALLCMIETKNFQ